MEILRVIFSNKDPLIAYHMLNGGGPSIPYSTTLEYIEYLDVYESIKEQGEKEMREAAKKQQQLQK
jgi:hypothetical protein